MYTLDALTRARIDALAQKDAATGLSPQPHAAEVQREITGRPVNFDTLQPIYDLYLTQFEGHKQDMVAALENRDVWEIVNRPGEVVAVIYGGSAVGALDIATEQFGDRVSVRRHYV